MKRETLNRVGGRTEQEHHEMMISPRRWPQLVLPLKRNDNHNLDMKGLGVIVELNPSAPSDGTVCFIEGVLMYQGEKIARRLTAGEYRIVDAWDLIHEGWYVD